jgi:hypothetical protein
MTKVETAKSEKLVKIRAKRAILIGTDIVEAGWEGEVSEELADQYCHIFEGQYAHIGLADSGAPLHEIVRAVRI